MKRKIFVRMDFECVQLVCVSAPEKRRRSFHLLNIRFSIFFFWYFIFDLFSKFSCCQHAHRWKKISYSGFVGFLPWRKRLDYPWRQGRHWSFTITFDVLDHYHYHHQGNLFEHIYDDYRSIPKRLTILPWVLCGKLVRRQESLVMIIIITIIIIIITRPRPKVLTNKLLTPRFAPAALSSEWT